MEAYRARGHILLVAIQGPCGSIYKTESGRGRKGVENDEESDLGQHDIREQCPRAVLIANYLIGRTGSIYEQ